MTLIIKKPFRDKETGAVYNPNDEVEFSDARAAVILADHRGLAVEKKAPAARSTTKSKKKK